MTKIKNNEFKCAMCGEIYTKDWSEEEAKKEAETIFGKPIEDWNGGAAVICDDCFNKVNPADNPEYVKKTKDII